MKNIFIEDVSLKASRNNSNALSFKERLEIAKRLSELGVDTIELPTAKDKTDEVLYRTLSACVTKTVLSCDAGNSEESLKKNYSLISKAKKKRLSLCVPVSPVQMEYFASKKPSAVLEYLSNMTKLAYSVCDDVEVVLDDATRAEPAFLYSAICQAIESGAKKIVLTNLCGDMLPEDFGLFVAKTFENIPELNKVSLSVKCSDEFSFGVSCAFAAIKSGADGVKVSVIDTGELPAFEKIIHALDFVGGKLGYNFAVNKTAIKRILKQIGDISSSSEKTESNEVNEELSEKLSSQEFSSIIKKRGYDLSTEEIKKVYAEFIRLSERKKVNTKELDVIVATTALQVPETYSLISFSVNTSNVLSSTASIVLNKNGETVKGLSFGNGAVDAAFLALENIVGTHYELDDFVLGSVTEGKEAMGQALVKLRSNGIIYSGRGVSTDIVGASIRAYINALNKIVYEEE